MLVETLGRHGFELFPEPCPAGQISPVATYTNLTDEMWDTDEGDVIWASDGFVTCFLYYDGQLPPEKKVRRTRDDEFVVMTVRNVECDIMASDAWQPERLEQALSSFRS